MDENTSLNAILLHTNTEWEWNNFLTSSIGQKMQQGTSSELFELVKRGFVLHAYYMHLKQLGGKLS